MTKKPISSFQYAHGVAIVFDLSRPETFEGALSWLSDVTEKLFDEKRELAAAEAAQVTILCLNERNSESHANKIDYSTARLIPFHCEKVAQHVPPKKYYS